MATSAGTGVYGNTLCWLDMSSFTPSAAATGQQMTESLPGGYTATFTVTVTGPRSVAPYAFPTYPNAYLGTGAYGGVAGFPALSQSPWSSSMGTAANQNSTTVKLSNIVVTDSAGRTVTGYSIVSADAESTDYPTGVAYPESITWTAGTPLTSLQPLGNACGGGFTGAGSTTVTCTGGGAGNLQLKTGTPILAATNPGSITAVMQASSSKQAVAFGFLFSNVTLKKTVVNPFPNDSFDLKVKDSNGNVQGSASTVPGGASASTGSTTIIGNVAGSPVTLSEQGASGNQGNYTASWSCSNAVAGTSGTLPSGNAGTSAQVTLDPGADVTCTITNTAAAAPAITVAKASTTTKITAVGQQVPFTFKVTNPGNMPLNNVTINETAFSGTGALSAISCPASSLAAGASETCTATYGTTYYGPYSGGLASMRSSALELKSFVGRVLASTGATKVDIVGHSEGTTVPAYYMKFDGGGAVVDQFVGYGSNFQGTSLNGLQTLSQLLGFQSALNYGGCPACNEFAPNSQFTADLNAGGVTVSGPHYTSIVTQRDEVVTPYTSGILAAAPNVTNITLQDVCPTDQDGHVALAIDPNVEQIVGNALDPAHAVPVNCVPMPFAF